jgi:hypothetical protein
MGSTPGISERIPTISPEGAWLWQPDEFLLLMESINLKLDKPELATGLT